MMEVVKEEEDQLISTKVELVTKQDLVVVLVDIQDQVDLLDMVLLLVIMDLVEVAVVVHLVLVVTVMELSLIHI